MTYQILEGDCSSVLATLEPQSVQTCVTSPPYWGLRDYGNGGQLGLEPTPEEYVANLVSVFREVKRVLRDDATLWLNLGDSFGPGKQLVGIPWRVAFALQADGWVLRSDIIWAKPNPMPESVTDRPTKAHEYLFLLTKSPRYFYDADAIREESLDPADDLRRMRGDRNGSYSQEAQEKRKAGIFRGDEPSLERLQMGRNKRSVWTVTTQPFPGAHFATFPPKLIEPCILAGSPPKCCAECGAPWERVVEREPNNDGYTNGPGGVSRGHMVGDEAHRGNLSTVARYDSTTTGWQATCNHDDDSGTPLVLDPFAGAGTAGVVALRHNRSFIGIELNPAYAQMARNRIYDDGPLLNVEVG